MTRPYKPSWTLTQLLLLITLIVLAQSACNRAEDTRIAEATVDEFHSRLDSEKYHEIYLVTTDDFKKDTSEPDLTELLKTVHQKLGNVKTARNTSMQVRYTTWGNFVNANYETTFEHSRAQERFTILLSGRNGSLVSYQISSRELVAR
jgi:hypothetical protein